MMDIQQFADNNRLKTRVDDCGEKIIPGKQGQIYEYSESELGVMFMPRNDRWTPKHIEKLRRTQFGHGLK